MDNKPLVSILMTAYNREKYIAEAIESVLVSTYQNWELIVVDDCSSDKTVEIVRGFETKDTRIKVYVNEKNLGDYANRNKTASFAKGKYLKYLDSDDKIYPNGLLVMVETMEKFPGAALGLSREFKDNKNYPILLSSQESYVEHFLGRGVFTIGPSGTIILREAFEKENGFSGERYVGDTELWMRLGAKYPVVIIKPDLIWWRKHEGQEYQFGLSCGYYEEQDYKIKLRMVNHELCPLEPGSREKVIFRVKQHHARRILSLFFKKKQFMEAWQLFRRSKLNFVELLRGFRPYI